MLLIIICYNFIKNNQILSKLFRIYYYNDNKFSKQMNNVFIVRKTLKNIMRFLLYYIKHFMIYNTMHHIK